METSKSELMINLLTMLGGQAKEFKDKVTKKSERPTFGGKNGVLVEKEGY